VRAPFGGRQLTGLRSGCQSRLRVECQTRLRFEGEDPVVGLAKCAARTLAKRKGRTHLYETALRFSPAGVLYRRLDHPAPLAAPTVGSYVQMRKPPRRYQVFSGGQIATEVSLTYAIFPRKSHAFLPCLQSLRPSLESSCRNEQTP
jgi:hypothetical protein